MKRIISIILILTLFMSCLAVPVAAMDKGSTGYDVYWHQKTMNFLGFNCGTEDAIYGSKTVSATKTFQETYDLIVDGIAGPETIAKEKELVMDIQNKLTDLGYGNLSIDGLPGINTFKALKLFQKDFGFTQNGICDNATLKALNETYTSGHDDINDQIEILEEMCLNSWTLPLKDDFKSITGSRKFASSRDSGKRAHAGIDFVADAGTTVYAMTSGKVLQVYSFYQSTKAVEVQNDDGSILRYCEISPTVKAGDKINQGDTIGTIKRATGGTSMLHIELYSGIACGSLTQRSNTQYTYVDSTYNFQRRSDLMDPSFLINLDILK